MAIADINSILSRSFRNDRISKISWEKGNYLNVTMCVTEECNLECTYCYMVGKNNFKKMTFETAKKIVDFIVNDPYCNNLSDNLLIDFIGGEPLLEMELIDKISDYICLLLYSKRHKWFNNLQFSFSTNGTLYDSKIMEDYLKKHRYHAGFGFSIDGTKEKHDLTRITRDGKGSYDKVIKSFYKYKQDYEDEIFQKSTFSSEDLVYLKDSIIHLWDLGFKNVESNLVYEDVWKEEDPSIFENQLKELADYMFESGRYLTHSVAYFEKRRGLPLASNSLNQNRCGAGYKSLAFDTDGNIYPCIRFLEMCSDDKKGMIVGSIDKGVDYNALRALCGTTWTSVSDEECNNCNVGTDCGWCVAQNYQENGSLYNRVKHICEMHKANVRANKYFWKRYELETGKTSDRVIEKVLFSKHNELKYVYFITSDDAPSFCNYTKRYNEGNYMSKDLYDNALKFCLDNEVLPIFLGSYEIDLDSEKKVFFEIDRRRIFKNPQISITVVDEYSENIETPVINYILRKNEIRKLKNTIERFCNNGIKRINLFISDMNLWNDSDITLYEDQLHGLCEYVVDLFVERGVFLQINVLSDRIMLEKNETRDCAAGINSVALAPNGKFYVCPGFYFTNPDWNIGNLKDGIDFSEKRKYFRGKSAMCLECDANACKRCLLDNKITTGEVNVPSSTQCKISFVEANAQKYFANLLQENNEVLNIYIPDDLKILKYNDYVSKMIFNDERAIADKWNY